MRAEILNWLHRLRKGTCIPIRTIWPYPEGWGVFNKTTNTVYCTGQTEEYCKLISKLENNPHLGSRVWKEGELAMLAEGHEEDTVANEAMRILQKRFNKTYFWCTDCDGVVTTPKKCCMTRLENELQDHAS